MVKYEKLPAHGRHIRLLRVPSSPDQDAPIRSTFEVRRLTKPGVYRALSYARGDLQDTDSIYIDGAEVLVPKTIVTFLRHIRGSKANSSLVIWVDAVCINQKDDNEKSQQVQLAGEIYEKAKEVFGWLGEHKDDSETALRALISGWAKWGEHNGVDLRTETGIEYFFNNKYGPDTTMFLEDEWTAATKLFKRPFWTRRWILQEIVVAKKVKFVCGKTRMDFEEVEAAILIWQNLRDPKWRHFTAKWHDLIHGVPIGSVYLLIQLRARRRYGSVLIGDSDEDIIRLLDLCARTLRVTDPRDRLYAIRSLVRDEHLIEVDYSKSSTQTFVDFAKGIISNGSHQLNVLRYAGIDYATTDTPSLPSWVPNWSWRTAAEGLGAKGYSASGNKAPRHEFGTLYCLPEDSASKTPNRIHSLRASGTLCGGIHHVEPADIFLQDPRKILSPSFAFEYLHTRYRTGIPLITAYFRTMMLDLGPLGSGKRLAVEDPACIDSAAAFFCFLEAMMDERLIRHEGGVSAGILSTTLEKANPSIPDYALSFADWCGETATGRTLQEIMQPFFGSATIVWPSETNNNRGWENLENFVVQLHSMTKKTFFKMDNGYMGVGPNNTREGDVVSVIWGCGVPLVMRLVQDYYIIVGPCFVLGLMDGEAVQMVSKGEAREEKFLIG